MEISSLPSNKPTKYQLYPRYTGSDGGKIPLFLLPPTYTAGAASQPITLPLLWTRNSSPEPFKNDDFSFAVQGNAVAITLLGVNMWGAMSTRPTLMSNFTSFLEGIETQFEIPGLLLPGSTARIARSIAALLPAPPVETLFYRYGLSTGLLPNSKAFVDIRPGMQLRVDFQSSQFTAPGSGMNGYVGSGSCRLQVGTVAGPDGPNGSRLIAFDPFLASIKAPLVDGASGQQILAGGALDLQPAGGARAYWRLFYPAKICSPGEQGDSTVPDNVTLVGASTLADLNSATQSFPNPVAGAGQPILYAVFLGRATVVPEIPIWVALGSLPSSLRHVPLGTTFANLIEGFGSPPISPANLGQFTLTRSMPAPVGGSVTLSQFLLPDMTSVPNNMWDVPLIAGDIVSISSQ